MGNKKTSSDWKNIARVTLKKHSSVVVLLAIVILASCISDVFLTKNNILNVLRQITANGILSIGLLMVIMTGGMDISIGSLVGVTSVFFVAFYFPDKAESPFQGFFTVMNKILPSGAAGMVMVLIILLIIGALLGFINGIVICKANVQPFIMTIGTLTLYRGIALLASNGKPIYMDEERANMVSFIGSGSVLGEIPTQLLVLILVAVIVAFLLNKTIYGRYVRAIGGNEEAARVAGINVDRYKVVSYMLCSMMAVIAGFVLTSRTTTGDPTLGNSFEMNAIASCVIGGASLNGGVGTVFGTIIGAVIIGIINNILNLANISTYYQYVVRGGIIILAVIFNSKKKRK